MEQVAVLRHFVESYIIGWWDGWVWLIVENASIQSGFAFSIAVALGVRFDEEMSRGVAGSILAVEDFKGEEDFRFRFAWPDAGDPTTRERAVRAKAIGEPFGGDARNHGRPTHRAGLKRR